SATPSTTPAATSPAGARKRASETPRSCRSPGRPAQGSPTSSPPHSPERRLCGRPPLLELGAEPVLGEVEDEDAVELEARACLGEARPPAGEAACAVDPEDLVAERYFPLAGSRLRPALDDRVAAAERRLERAPAVHAVLGEQGRRPLAVARLPRGAVVAQPGVE